MRLSTRLTLAVVALVVATTAAVGMFTYFGIKAAILPEAFARISQHTYERARDLSESIGVSRLDALSFRGTNSVAAIVGAQVSGAPDGEWRAVLGARLISELASKPEYYRFRLIGVANGGRELVRVDRSGPSGAIRVVPAAELQQTGDRDYFQAAVRLAPDEVYVSPVRLSRRNGNIEFPYVPMVHTATPLYASNGRIAALIVITVDLRWAFGRLRNSVGDGGQIYLINADGDYLVHPDPSQEFGFELGTPVRAHNDFPVILGQIQSEGTAAQAPRTYLNEDRGVVLAAFELAGGPQLAVIEKVPPALIHAPALAAARSSLIVGVLAALIAAALALALAGSLTRPLKQITAAVDSFREDPPIALPTDAAGEIGALARAFESMEQRLRRVNRMYRTIIICNQRLIRMPDEETLSQAVCETMVEGGYRMAWVGYGLQDENRSIVPIAQAGEDHGYIVNLHLTWADTERGSGPGARCIRQGTVQVTRHIPTDPTYGFWREEAIKRGYASSIAMPLKDAEGTFGVLGVYSDVANAFDEEEVRMLTRVADDLAFGIVAARDRAERRKAEEQLRLALKAEAIQKQAEERYRLALRDAQAELAHVSRITTMGELTASIAHEINQPLAAIASNSDASSRWLAGDPPNLREARGALARVAEQARRAGDVLKRIRTLLKKNRPEYAALDLNDAITEVLALTRVEQQKNRVAVRTKLSAGLPPVLGDRVQLQQVVLNLVMNGIEAMSAVVDRPRVLSIHTYVEDGGGVQVRIEDTGTGFDPNVAPRLFDPFFTTKADGMGMGLAISRSIVEAHGGRLTVSPGVLHGAVFRFSISSAAAAATKDKAKDAA
jgi:signal transduction histidine kinase